MRDVTEQRDDGMAGIGELERPVQGSLNARYRDRTSAPEIPIQDGSLTVR